MPLSEDDGPPPEVVREEVTLTVDGRVLPVTTGRVVVGRSRECDVRVDDGNVSRRHFELVQEGPTAWVVSDLGSTNGTEVNGRRVSGRRRLDDGDRITIGSTELVFGRTLPVSVAVTVDEALLGLKVAFLVLLYLFVWLVVRSATRGLTVGAPQESIILPASEAAALRAAAGISPRRVVVLASPALQPGTAIELSNSARRRARRRERDPPRRGHDRLEPARDDRQPVGRPLGRGHRAPRTGPSSTALASRARACSSPAT